MTDVAVAIGLVREAMSKTVSRVIGSGLGSTARRPGRPGVGDHPAPADQDDRAGNFFVLDRAVDGGIDALEPLGVKTQRRRGRLGQGRAGRVIRRPTRRASTASQRNLVIDLETPSRGRSVECSPDKIVLVRSIVAWQGVQMQPESRRSTNEPRRVR